MSNESAAGSVSRQIARVKLALLENFLEAEAEALKRQIKGCEEDYSKHCLQKEEDKERLAVAFGMRAAFAMVLKRIENALKALEEAQIALLKV